jgi:hypothetical protein
LGQKKHNFFENSQASLASQSRKENMVKNTGQGPRRSDLLANDDLNNLEKMRPTRWVLLLRLAYFLQACSFS